MVRPAALSRLPFLHLRRVHAAVCFDCCKGNVRADLKQRAEYAKPRVCFSLWGVCPPVSQPGKICDGEISAIISSSAMKTERSVEWCFKALTVEAKRNGKTCRARLSYESRFAADTVICKSWCLLKDLHLQLQQCYSSFYINHVYFFQSLN